MELSTRMDDKRSGREFLGLIVGPHDASPFKTEVDFDGPGMSMIRALLTWFPTSNRHVTVGISSQYLLDPLVTSELLLGAHVEHIQSLLLSLPPLGCRHGGTSLPPPTDPAKSHRIPPLNR